MVGNAKIAPDVQARASAHISTLFLEDEPVRFLKDGKFASVPVMLGVTRDVGSYLVDMGMYLKFSYQNFKNLENTINAMIHFSKI